MDDKNKKEPKKNTTNGKPLSSYRKDAPGAISGINTPGIDLPAFNPPVPNRAWTAMRQGLDIDELTEEERRDLYIGRLTVRKNGSLIWKQHGRLFLNM